ncbi:DUF2380 domain-containing protein [Amaricoccus sp. B4]|uniref:DUF2380 domain-containing protein n=1 Tax=Amaricoccus sp. B4 TaxID=3368557 RepID=UPI003717769B
MRRAIWGMAILAAMALAPEARAERLAILPVKLLDTSGEAQDQTAAHDARLAALTEGLARDMASQGSETVVITADKVAAACPREVPQCLLDLSRESGAERALFCSVLKTSSLIMQMFVQVVDVESGQVVQRRDLNFRGDNDESWARAEAFLVKNLATGE